MVGTGLHAKFHRSTMQRLEADRPQRK